MDCQTVLVPPTQAGSLFSPIALNSHLSESLQASSMYRKLSFLHLQGLSFTLQMVITGVSCYHYFGFIPNKDVLRISVVCSQLHISSRLSCMQNGF